MLQITPLFFMLSGIVTLRQREDLSGYCPQEESHHKAPIMLAASHESAKAREKVYDYFDDPAMMLLHSIANQNYLETFFGLS